MTALVLVRRRVSLGLLCLVVASSCLACGIDPPMIDTSANVVSVQTANDVIRKALEEIAQNEQRLGTALRPPRILLVKLLRPGESYSTAKRDGTNPHGMGLGPSDGPGWVVEAEGTFIGVDPVTNRIDSKGTHGFFEFDDSGAGGWAFYPCWTRTGAQPEDLEGSCP